MARPVKVEEDLQRNLVKAYLTDYERELLDDICEKLRCSLSKAIVSGIYAIQTIIKCEGKE